MAVLNEEQAMLKDMAVEWVRDRMPISVVRGLYDHGGGGKPGDGVGFDRDTYAEMAAMGWTGIVVPETFGGADFGYLSLGLIVEELGRTLAPSPLLSSAFVAASALRLGGSAAQQERLLPGIAAGSLIGTLAVDEGAHHAPARITLAAARSGAGWRLDGMKRPVQDGMGADLFIVAARTAGAPGDTHGITLFLVPADSAGLDRRRLDQIDARCPALLTFEAVALDEDAVLGMVDEGYPLLEAILDRARIGVAAELLGLATQAFDTTLDYLKTRVQFGQIIGSFQALQHRASEMFGELQLTRSAVEAALDALDAGDANVAQLASLAKAIAGETAHLISNQMVQLHGGIGMTHEHDAGLYLKRARVAEQCYGGASFHRERWGRLNGY
ncbi:acyl-CoA dehydrogenase family protein [Flavisphingomonas formosensis]|uniref:acyl-CoA dehydrogenase family protein n=1 Tax=Flavisphingomonas formosensis TaxID=861534 RepID=UPI0012F9D0D8|nr:acyl-CoA dehydrogenase family protein [Sphingomonas formosensis]